MIATAKEILADDPKDFTAMYWISMIVPAIPNGHSNTEYLDLAEKAARNAATTWTRQFAADKRPATTPEDEWKKARTDMEADGLQDGGLDGDGEEGRRRRKAELHKSCRGQSRARAKCHTGSA